MQLNHVAPQHFEVVVEMLKTKLGFVELRRTGRAVWLRQPGSTVDLQFSRSDTPGRDADKEFSLDAPAAFVNFVIETMTPDLADYGV